MFKDIQKSLLIPTIISLLILIGFSFTTIGVKILHEKKWIIFLVIFISSFFTTFVTHFGIENNPSKFILYYFFSMFARIIIILIFIFTSIYFKVNNPLLFLINSFFLYFLYLFFEIYNLFFNLQRDFKLDS
ncbi:MAG: hypothetical protein EAZ44_03445 [Cytophagia bacterium]|nr:MAG: hypothetical protein EAY69_00790 [Cytophagales bacterium]TAG05566.1 MAG: hypothetical protein EAZ44_03445 [Cytophagia bacterium]TAG43930.1 MAG: hypothetical protein EAZ31_03260 [Cytophagia bacterium]TAH29933.1 MAG: hypothetical protein EAZ06_05080 [Cytophagales bacterium]